MLTAMVTPSRQIIFVQFNLLYWGSMTTSSLQLTSVYWLIVHSSSSLIIDLGTIIGKDGMSVQTHLATYNLAMYS